MQDSGRRSRSSHYDARRVRRPISEVEGPDQYAAPGGLVPPERRVSAAGEKAKQEEGSPPRGLTAKKQWGNLV
jgi:hypothetical protein